MLFFVAGGYPLQVNIIKANKYKRGGLFHRKMMRYEWAQHVKAAGFVPEIVTINIMYTLTLHNVYQLKKGMLMGAHWALIRPEKPDFERVK